jgi:hypothetical protein
MTAITMNTKKKAHHMPALKIVPIIWQLLRKERDVNKIR